MFMNSSSLSKIGLGLGLGLIIISSVCLADSSVPKVSEEIYKPLKLEEGTWDAAITFYEADKPTDTATGVQVNRLLENGHWITNEFRIPAFGKFPAYEGHGVWGYDPVAKTYVDTWVDTNDVAVRTDYGYWNANENTMIWSAKQPDGQGHFIDYRMTEEFKGDTRIFTFYQLGIVKPVQHILIKIVFTKRKLLPR
jgi:hypothetical protein